MYLWVQADRILGRVPIAIILSGVLKSFLDNSRFAAPFFRVSHPTDTVHHLKKPSLSLIPNRSCRTRTWVLSICLLQPQTRQPQQTVIHNSKAFSGKETCWLQSSGAPAPSFHSPVTALPFLLSTIRNSLITSRLLKAELLRFGGGGSCRRVERQSHSGPNVIVCVLELCDLGRLCVLIYGLSAALPLKGGREQEV